MTSWPAVAVVIPACDEQALLPAALDAVREAAGHPALDGVRVLTVVVADCCTDATEELAGKAGALVVPVRFRNVGRARAAGVAAALEALGEAEAAGAGRVQANPAALGRVQANPGATDGMQPTPGAPAGAWIANTDADSTVPPDWLAFQLARAAEGWDAVVGTVAVDRRSAHKPRLAARHHRLYEVSRPPAGQPWQHPHVHGANLGVSARAYTAAGGFPPLALSEDHGLVDALERTRARLLRTADCPVTTSARTRPRARGGFGDHLAGLDRIPRSATDGGEEEAG
ncbi:glycosyl transferase [Streptomyces spiroverticillatus]|uniref:Glycosyl transferase n=1 Tax=Streptomyces finlayi TaxID=67296 RepID=A0A918WZV9_9ACTN|nr:glycosyltransferase [Streptomyces finlayi]GHA16329.1 glycosyl transferase [Streptomyces spiroverticillatus]GHC98620.1 glycosyl transferase [Streptomyces finlayi]